MLRSSHRLTSLGWLLAGAVALPGCAPPGALLESRPPVPYFCTIRFAADDEEILIGRVSARDTVWRTMAPVFELGGRVTATIGDTLVLQPYYITRRAVAAGEQPTTIFRAATAAMPDVVLIPMTSQLSLRAFRTPVTARRRVPVIPLVLGGVFLLSLLALDVSLLSSL